MMSGQEDVRDVGFIVKSAFIMPDAQTQHCHAACLPASS